MVPTLRESGRRPISMIIGLLAVVIACVHITAYAQSINQPNQALEKRTSQSSHAAAGGLDKQPQFRVRFPRVGSRPSSKSTPAASLERKEEEKNEKGEEEEEEEEQLVGEAVHEKKQSSSARESSLDETPLQFVTKSEQEVGLEFEFERRSISDKAEKDQTPQASGSTEDLLKERYAVHVRTANGQKLQCRLPVIPIRDGATASSSHQELLTNTEANRLLWLQQADSLLQHNEGKCFYRLEGWWTFEYCFNRHIKQIHFGEKTSPRIEIVVGLLDTAKEQMRRKDGTAFMSKTSNYASSSSPMTFKSILQNSKKDNDASAGDVYELGPFEYAQEFESGTPCDLTGKPRRATLVFKCASQQSGLASLTKIVGAGSDYIDSVTEVETCVYRVEFHSRALCDHILYKQETHTHDIQCDLDPAEDVFVGLRGKNYRRAAWI
mmetsp:Transcript_12543/g.21406  ORF Transcript_12543/g.21406 Transcript_12543/m.21406 type:complete len:437 (-) Transcript_12543:59-1369(-)